jgi:RNA polymerase subunit RPABC4/transcription elongation factor Spt4
MKCFNCGVEYKEDVCPNCGAGEFEEDKSDSVPSISYCSITGQSTDSVYITTKPGAGHKTVMCPGCGEWIGGDEPFCPFCSYALWGEDFDE